jgi:hypothetical protein
MKRFAALIGPWLLVVPAQAAPPATDPDWPCMQRLVPTLTAGTYWTGPDATQDWHADPTVVAIVNAIAPRAVPQDAAVAKLQTYIAAVAAPARAASSAILFAGLVEETNRQRDQIIDRLRALTRRQREISQIVEHIAIPAPDADPSTRDEAVQRRKFLIREFQGTESTIRYACEVPVQLEARLGAFGRTLDAAQ